MVSVINVSCLGLYRAVADLGERPGVGGRAPPFLGRKKNKSQK